MVLKSSIEFSIVVLFSGTTTTTPWVIFYNNEKYYIDYYIVKTFFDNLNLGDYFYFKDLFYYIFHIETILLQDKECSDIK